MADAASSDDTAAVARGSGARVLAVDNDLNFNVNKTKALDACGGEWLLYVDPDERVPAELARRIREIADAADTPFAVYEFPRLNNYFGRYLRYGGNYPDYQLRLFRRGRGRFACRSVHERLEIDGPVGRLRPALLHETYPTVDDYLRKLPLFVRAGADYLEKRGQARGFAQDLGFLVIKPQWRFLRRYIFKLGVLDGWPGLLAAYLDALQTGLTYYEYRNRKR